MSSVRRSVNLLVGALLGQGMLFGAYTYGMLNNSEAIGYLSTSLGIVVLMVMALEYGGGIILRQFDSDQDLINKVAAILCCRIVILVLLLIGIGVAAVFHLIDNYIEQFILAALVGIAVSVFNFTGLLDVKTQYSTHALLSGLHQMLLSVFIVLGGENPLIGGALVTVGLLINFVVQALYVYRWSQQNGVKFVCEKAALKEVFAEGGYVMMSTLPGQILPRFFGVFLLGVGGASAAAVYNYLKLVQGLFNQGVTIFRRAEYPRLIGHYGQAFVLRQFMAAQKFSVAGSFMGVFLIATLLMFHNKLNVDFGAVVLLIVQSLLWFGTSLYFLWLQVQRNNKVQGFYGVLIVLLALVVFWLVDPHSALTVLLVEIISSVIAFIIVLLLNGYRDDKRSYS